MCWFSCKDKVIQCKTRAASFERPLIASPDKCELTILDSFLQLRSRRALRIVLHAESPLRIGYHGRGRLNRLGIESQKSEPCL